MSAQTPPSTETNSGKAPRLSVAIIARDCHEALAATLDNVRSIADQIVVVDTGSSDATRKTAVNYGAQVVEQRWDDDFSAARNAAWPHLQGAWVLWLDADERLSPDDAQSLRRFVQTEPAPDCAYALFVAVPSAPGSIAGERVARIRLVPGGRNLKFEGRVRETLRPSLSAAGIRIQSLPWQLVRSARQHDREIKRFKAERDARLAELEIREHGEQPATLLALGEAVLQLGNPTGASACFRRAIEISAEGSTSIREAYYGLLTCYDADPAQRHQQVEVCLEALSRFPLDAQLLCAMGGYLQAQDQLELAARSYRTAFEYGEIDRETWHVADIGQIAAICLNLIYQAQNKDDMAREVLVAALSQAESSSRVRRHLIDLDIKHDRRREALEEVDRLPAETPHREALRTAVRGACLAAKQSWAPALGYLQTAYTAGCRDPICLRWLSLALMSIGEPDTALPILRQWQAVEPRSIELQKYLAAVSGPTPADPQHWRVDGEAEAPAVPHAVGDAARAAAISNAAR